MSLQATTSLCLIASLGKVRTHILRFLGVGLPHAHQPGPWRWVFDALSSHTSARKTEGNLRSKFWGCA